MRQGVWKSIATGPENDTFREERKISLPSTIPRKMRETTCSLTMIGLSGNGTNWHMWCCLVLIWLASLWLYCPGISRTLVFIETKLKLPIFTLPTTRQNFSVVFKTSQKVCKCKCISKRKWRGRRWKLVQFDFFFITFMRIVLLFIFWSTSN